MAKSGNLTALHPVVIGVADVVISDQVQRAVHHQMGPVGTQTFLLLTSFGTQHLGTDHQVAQGLRLIGRTCRRRHLGDRERQHVGRLVLAPELRVEAATLSRPHDRYTDFATGRTTTQRRARPGRELASRRRPRPDTPPHVYTNGLESVAHEELLWAS